MILTLLRRCAFIALAVSAAEQRLCVPWHSADHTVVESSLTFLPSPPATRGPPQEDGLALALRSRLQKLGRACTRPFYPVGSRNAWGSHVNSLVFPLAYAVARNRTALTPSLGAYTNGSCSTFACFFRPLASDSCEARRQLRACSERKKLFACGGRLADSIEDCEDQSHCASTPDLRVVALKKGEFSFGIHGLEAIPREYRARGHFWYVAHLLSWLLRPNKVALAAMKRRAADIGLTDGPRPMIGVHARAGDSCIPTQESKKARRCSSFSDYWYHVVAMKALYGAKSVLFATDDARFAAQATNASTPRFPVFVSYSAPPSAPWDDALEHDSSLDRTRTALGVIVDIALLARTDAFVGKFTSNVDRVAYALLVARSSCLKPFVSLDALWCHDWSNAVGQSIHGTFLC